MAVEAEAAATSCHRSGAEVGVFDGQRSALLDEDVTAGPKAAAALAVSAASYAGGVTGFADTTITAAKATFTADPASTFVYRRGPYIAAATTTTTTPAEAPTTSNAARPTALARSTGSRHSTAGAEATLSSSAAAAAAGRAAATFTPWAAATPETSDAAGPTNAAAAVAAAAMGYPTAATAATGAANTASATGASGAPRRGVESGRGRIRSRSTLRAVDTKSVAGESKTTTLSRATRGGAGAADRRVV